MLVKDLKFKLFPNQGFQQIKDLKICRAFLPTNTSYISCPYLKYLFSLSLQDRTGNPTKGPPIFGW
jgi:hypothetical protein